MEKGEKGIEKIRNSKRQIACRMKNLTTQDTIETKDRITKRVKEMNDTRSKKGMKNTKENKDTKEYWSMKKIAWAIQNIASAVKDTGQ